MRALSDHDALHSFLEAAPDAVVVIDQGRRIIHVNAQTERLFGFPREELIGERIELLVPERFGDADAVQRTRDTQDSGLRSFGEGLDLQGRRKDGSQFPIEISLSPLETNEGTHTISIIRDITMRRHAEARFQALLESAPDGIVVVDSSGSIQLVNSQVEQMFGYGRQELIGQRVEMLVPERFHHSHVAYREGYVREPRTRPMGAGRELMGRKRNGQELPVEISLSPLKTEQSLFVTAIIRDITERRNSEAQIKASLREKEVLLKEIHHRVKNNLQVTSSLLKLQSAHIQDPATREMFAESQNRIRSMALVHEKLYQSRELSRIDFLDYIRDLSALLQRSFASSPQRIMITTRGDPVFLSIHTAVPCGLIVNELLSNCLKHAFPHGRSGEIEISITCDGREGPYLLTVRDNGVGLPPGLDIGQTETLGLQLVRRLTEQLQGTMTVTNEGGTSFFIHFSEVKS